jgi:LacI family transcriptional regulator
MNDETFHEALSAERKRGKKMGRSGGNPSMRMVADRAGVSMATVSNVLNGKASVAPDIAERVRLAVEGLGYVRDSRASRLRSGQSRLVGVIVPDLTNPMFASFVSILEHVARIDGYDLVVVSSRNAPDEERERLRNIREWRPAGLIVIPCDGALEERLPTALSVPLVVADRIPDAARFDLVAVDNAASAGAIVRHLRAQGVRSCLVAGTSLGISNVRERWEGAAGEAGGTRLVLIEVGFEDHAPPALADALKGPGRPDALFCLDHETTLAAFQLLGEMGLQPGADLAFASFDEMEWMRLVTPAVTAVRQPVVEMAECAWSLLSRRMAGDAGPPQSRRLRCAVTFRGSTPRQPASNEVNQTSTGGTHP